jgi:catechol 2,3-dioxygenase-like lactoylglutathione lyase family enzyme
MRLGHVELFCKDCEKTRDFYVGVLGFEEAEVQAQKYIWLRSDASEILLRPNGRSSKSKANMYAESQIAMVIYCQDLNSLAERLSLADAKVSESDEVPDVFTFQDPDGRWLQAVEND